MVPVRKRIRIVFGVVTAFAAVGVCAAGALLALSVVSPPEKARAQSMDPCDDPAIVCVPSIDSVSVDRTSDGGVELRVVGTASDGSPVDQPFFLSTSAADNLAAEIAWRSCKQFARKGMTSKFATFWFEGGIVKFPACGNASRK